MTFTAKGQIIGTTSCNGNLGNPIVNETFGSGTGFGAPLATGVTTLTYQNIDCVNDGQYTIVNHSSNCFNNYWHLIHDHTGDPNGYFMLINADINPNDFYVQTVSNLCKGTTYLFSAWVANLINTYGNEPNITFSVETPSGQVLQYYETGYIPIAQTPTWTQYGFYFTTPANINTVVLRMKNNAKGGTGNDLALDDIVFRPAGPETTVGLQNGDDAFFSSCSPFVTLYSKIGSCYLQNAIQWQTSSDQNSWINIDDATKDSLEIVNPSEATHYYRISVSASGNDGVTSCNVYSNVFTLNYFKQPVTEKNIDTTICNSSSLILPSGKIATQDGVYIDTLRTTQGCDSVITHLSLNLTNRLIIDTTITICQGVRYQLPSGKTIDTSGYYIDTVRSSSGCDSIITQINLKVLGKTIIDTTVIKCDNQTYKLPSGIIVNTTGEYQDTVKNSLGCDSIITQLHLYIGTPKIIDTSVSVCQGSSFTFLSGKLINTSGQYQDTVRNNNGCDSIITNLNLNILIPINIDTSIKICKGASYTLPNGLVVNIAGTYIDTLLSSIGCDSIIRKTTIQVLAPIIVDTTIISCQGTSYTFPSGIVVDQTGEYNDTIKNAMGCDSIVTQLHLYMGSPKTIDSTVYICQGSSYSLPSGKIVNTSGIYKDTIQSKSGCDSIITNLQLNILKTQTANFTTKICQGSSYTLPNGKTVNQSGIYIDTLHNVLGCDSLIRITTIETLNPITIDSTVYICNDSHYTLNNGLQINQPGLVHDTIKSYMGCDSIFLNINIKKIVPTSTGTNTVMTCIDSLATLRPTAGFSSYRWSTGATTQTIAVPKGNYSVQLSNEFGCSTSDTFDVTYYSYETVTIQNKNNWICKGDTHILEVSNQFQSYLWNTGAITARISTDTIGFYKVTVKNKNNCPSSDSVNIISYRDTPVAFLGPDTSKCSFNTLEIIANGKFYTYIWSTGETQSSITIKNAGTYWLKVEDIYGCKGIDSVIIAEGKCKEYALIPTGFTPNKDGRNDTFRPIFTFPVQKFTFLVFNRWGQKIFETNLQGKGWDGTINGQLQKTDTFIWYLSFQNLEGESIIQKGTVVLVR